MGENKKQIEALPNYKVEGDNLLQGFDLNRTVKIDIQSDSLFVQKQSKKERNSPLHHVAYICTNRNYFINLREKYIGTILLDFKVMFRTSMGRLDFKI